jgi:electron transport complex protein RnfE
MNKAKLKETALAGITNNPIFVLVLGMCPTIAMSTNITQAAYMGLSTLTVLVMSNLLISIFRKLIPEKVRIPCYIIIIATLVTAVEMALKKFFPSVYPQIGPFVKLIVVNCIILARAEAFASSSSPGYSALDGLSIGLGFVFSICLLGGVRQLLSLALPIFGTTAAGGFLTLGILMGVFNCVYQIALTKSAAKRKKLKMAGGAV